MIEGCTARIVLPGKPAHAGTAWRFEPRYALTAAHCVGDRTTRQITSGVVQLAFKSSAAGFADPVAATVLRHDFDLDVALLEMQGAPADAPCQPLAGVPPLSDEALDQGNKPLWRAYAYPLAKPSGMVLDGSIDAADMLDNRRALQLACNQGGLGALVLSSGAAIRCGGYAVGVLRWSPPELKNRVIYASTIADVASVFPEVQARISAAAAPRPEPDDADSGYLDCDRTEQWRTLLGAFGDARDAFVFVPGRDREAHEALLERLALRQAATAELVRLEWPSGGAPSTKVDFVDAIHAALETSGRGVRGALRARGPARKKVLVHPSIHLDLDAGVMGAIADYYGDWLPEVLGDRTEGDRAVLVVQPVRWQGGVRDWLRGPCLTARRRVRRLVATIGERLAHRRIDAVALPELAPIGATDIRGFLREQGLPEARTARILEEARGMSSQEVLDLLRRSAGTPVRT